jgi:hypothetical protein
MLCSSVIVPHQQHPHTQIYLFFLFWLYNKVWIILWGNSSNRGTWRSWWKHCATNQKVPASIPDGVVRIFHWHNPSGRTMALGLTEPLTQMSTRNISWGRGKGGWCVGLTTLPPSCADCLEILVPQPPGTLRACPGQYKDCFTSTLTLLTVTERKLLKWWLVQNLELHVEIYWRD